MEKSKLRLSILAVFITSVSTYLYFSKLSFRGNILILTLFWFLLSIFLIIFFDNSVRRNIGKVAARVASMADGDLTSKIPVGNSGAYKELGNSINALLLSVRRLINESATMSDKVINYCETLNSNTRIAEEAADYSLKSISGVSADMMEQLLGTQQTEQLVCEILDEHGNVTQSGQQIENLANSLFNTVRETSDIFDELTSRLNQSADSNSILSSRVNALNDKAGQIQSIADKVTAISKNTGLLSFNAAIEAAKAGDTGLGFAVVAEEIRKLSQMSSQQARDIQNIIDEIKSEIHGISAQMNNEIYTIRGNLDFSRITKVNLGNITDKNEKTLQSVEEINKIIKYQSKKFSVIRRTVEKAAGISSSTAASTQQAAASFENQLSAMQSVFGDIQNLTVMNRKLKENIDSFAQKFVITEDIKQYIDQALQRLKELLKNPDLASMEYGICTDILKEHHVKYPQFELFAVMEKSGMRKAITLDYTEQEVYVNYAHRTYFKEAIRGNEYMSDPYISTDTLNYCIAIAAPVADSSGKIVGILMGDLILG